VWQRYREHLILVKKLKNMPRPLRMIDPNGTYHIINRGNNKKRIFFDESDYNYFLLLISKMKDDFKFLLHHFVLMPNHFHFVLSPNGDDLSSVMRILQGEYARYFSEKNKHVGHVWQSRYKSFIIDNDAYLLACGNYIEMNPVRARLSSLSENWEWSSYRYYAFGEKNDLLTEDPFFRDLAVDINLRRKIYQNLVDKTRS